MAFREVDVTGRTGKVRVGGEAGRGMMLAVLWLLASGVSTARLVGQSRDPRGDAAEAHRVVTSALEWMGGEGRLASVRTVRFDMMTQWQRTGFRDVPWTDRPSFEPHVDVRDYTIPAWRNTRDFGSRKITNVVRDSVAVTSFGTGFQPLSVAYVDERDELFTYTPDRLVLRLAGAEDLRVVGDTLIGGEPHTVVAATLDGFQNGGPLEVSVAFHDGTGLPTRLRFRRGHPNDFGLVPLGRMWVEVWYSSWRTFGGVSIPTQWDILRAGAPYKRMTVRSASFDPDFAADSFDVDPAAASAYLATVAPMHDRAMDSVRVVRPGVLAIHGFGYPTGVVQVGAQWVLFEAGQAPLNLERARAALTTRGGDVDAALVASARTANGGVVTLVDEGVPIFTSRAAFPFLEVMLANEERPVRGVTVVDGPLTLGAGRDVLLLDRVDLPDVPGSVLAYAAEDRWLYAPDVVTELDRRVALERARQLGWVVEAMGTGRALWTGVAGSEPDR